MFSWRILDPCTQELIGWWLFSFDKMELKYMYTDKNCVQFLFFMQSIQGS